MHLTNSSSRVRLANQAFIDPSTVKVVDQAGPNTITHVAPHPDADPPYYDVGYVLKNGAKDRRRLNHKEVSLLFQQGFSVLRTSLMALESFFNAEKRLKNKQDLRALTQAHPYSPPHPQKAIPQITPLAEHERPPVDQFATVAASKKRR